MLDFFLIGYEVHSLWFFKRSTVVTLRKMTEKDFASKDEDQIWKGIKENLCNLSGKHNVALFVDYPNLLMYGKRNEVIFDSGELLSMARRYGNLVSAKLYTTLRVDDTLRKEILKFEKIGYDVIIRPITKNAADNSKDIDTRLTADAISTLCDDVADIVIIASDDSDFVPTVRLINRRGKVSVAFVCSIDGSKAIVSSATTADLIPFHQKGKAQVISESEGLLEISDEV